MPFIVPTSGYEHYAGVTLEEVIEQVNRRLDPNDLSSLVELAPLLAGLSQDADILPRQFNKYVDAMFEASTHVAYTPQSFLLAVGRRAFLRANVWIPMRFASTLRSQEEKIFSYRQAHDHNFAFMTVGHFGPGYETDLWEYDPASVEGNVGETVDLRSLGREQLTPGKVMVFREKFDVHTQLPPLALSVSINIMVVPDADKLKDQFFFDTEKGCITSMPTMATPHKRVSVVELAGHIPSPDVLGVLVDLSRDARSWRIRQAALQGCCMNPLADASLKCTVLERALTDTDSRIRRTASALQSASSAA